MVYNIIYIKNIKFLQKIVQRSIVKIVQMLLIKLIDYLTKL